MGMLGILHFSDDYRGFVTDLYGETSGHRSIGILEWHDHSYNT